MAQVELERVSKRFTGEIRALTDVSVTVGDGELVVIVGPSGSGKTTALRIVAGLESLSAGRVLIGGRDMAVVSPRARDLAMVFQQPVVYPHLSVRDNVAYSLRARGARAAEIQQATERIATRLGIGHLLDRAPGTLSGGEAQRVAITRAAVRRPACLLLDEPLASLDAPLRRELRGELAELHKARPVTTLLVTHDQEEALALAERLVVLRAGKIEQVGTPEEIYKRPKNRFVAGFFGSPPPRFFEGRLMASEGRLWFESGAVRLSIAEPIASSLAGNLERPILMGVRPEAVRLAPWANYEQDECALEGRVTRLEFAGNRTLVEAATTDGASLTAAVADFDRAAVGESRKFFVDPGRLMFFAADDGGASLTHSPRSKLC